VDVARWRPAPVFRMITQDVTYLNGLFSAHNHFVISSMIDEHHWLIIPGLKSWFRSVDSMLWSEKNKVHLWQEP
jgi:hypothetical protein